MANVGPLTYSLIPRKYKTQKFVIICGYMIFIISCLSMLAMSLFWDIQTQIFGDKRSLILYLTTFGTSLCDCMTSIIFWVFVSYFPTQYMAILSAGESSSGIICAILIYIQQLNRPEDKPRYSVEIYLLILAMLIPVSAMAYTLLIRFLKNGYFDNATDWISTKSIVEESHNSSQPSQPSQFQSMSQSFSKLNQYNISQNNDTTETEMEMIQSNISIYTNKMSQYQSMKPSEPLIDEHNESDNNNNNNNNINNNNIIMSNNDKSQDTKEIQSTITLNTNQMNIIKDHQSSFKSNLMMSNGIVSEASTGITQNINMIILNNVSAGYWHWIVMIGALSGIQNGMLPAISSYSLLPYGDIAYILSVTISNIFVPISAILPVLFPTRLLNRNFIVLSSIGWLTAAIYILLIALESPHPWGVTKNDGNSSKEFWRVVIIIVSVCCSQLLTVCKTCIYLLIKKSFMLKANYLDAVTLEKGLSKMMEIVGIAVQVGSFCGAVIFFLLVNVGHFFNQ